MNFKKWILSFCIALLTVSGFAQYTITLQANILNKKNNKPIPYANISFKNQNLSAITNDNGDFTLSYQEVQISPDAILEISAFGYQTIRTTASQLYKLLKNTNNIYLIPETLSNHDDKQSDKEIIISGKVTANQAPLEGVTITVKNTLTETLTNVYGFYHITANPDDVLVFDFLGMKPKQVQVGDKDTLNIQLQSEAEVLEEVHLEGKVQRKEKIDLGLTGKKSFDAIGYDVKTMEAGDIKSHYTTLYDLLSDKFAGVVVDNPDIPDPKVYIPGRQGSINNATSAIFDVDGNVFDSFPPIEIQQIKSLNIIKSLAGTNKYGSRGRGGVIVIKTKTFSEPQVALEKPSDLAKGNDYTEDLEIINLTSLPNYLKPLKNAQNVEQAKDIYRVIVHNMANPGINFYIDAAQYFFKSDNSYAYEIRSAAEGLAKDNVKALKSLAFHYQALNNPDRARLLYQRIAHLRPYDAQSYRDLANIYQETGDYNQAMQLYRHMLSNTIKGIDFKGLKQPLIDELRHLLAFHRSQVDYKWVPGDLLTAGFKQDLRIVFEWNDPTAEFELQFVNPQKKFYTWAHTLFDNRERLLDEIKRGYSIEAYQIDDAQVGDWIINLNTLYEDSSLNPNYLKYTLYKNYGEPNETKTIKVIPLYTLKQKVILDKFFYQ